MKVNGVHVARSLMKETTFDYDAQGNLLKTSEDSGTIEWPSERKIAFNRVGLAIGFVGFVAPFVKAGVIEPVMEEIQKRRTARQTNTTQE